MNKPKLPITPLRDTKAQRQKRLDYIFFLIGQGNTVDSSCRAAGTTRKSLYAWTNSDPEIMARYEEVQIELHEEVKECAKLCALKAIDDHRYQASMMFYLKCRDGWNDGSGFTTGAQEMPSIQFTKPKKSRNKVT